MTNDSRPGTTDEQRLEVVRRMRSLNEIGEPTFDDLIQLAMATTTTPIGALSLLDADCYWFQSAIGLDTDRISRAEGFVDPDLGEDHQLVVPDLRSDPRFHDHRFVVGPPYARFYLGVPIYSGIIHIGTLSVMDVTARTPRPDEIVLLHKIARQANRLLELRWLRSVGAPPSQASLDQIAQSLTSVGEFDDLADFEVRPAWMYDTRSLELFAVNNAAVQQYGWSKAELVTMRFTDLLPPEDAELLQAVTHVDQIPPSNGRSWRHQRRDGSVFSAQVVSSPIPSVGPTLRLVVATDTTNRLFAEGTLNHAATHDPLTGLANRALCFDTLTSTMASQGAGGPSVLYLDLDEFKRVNDSGGHTTGDAVLSATAGRLLSAVREGDLVARMGGDEFAIICPATDLRTAIRIATRVHEVLGYPLVVEDRSYSLKASIGVATVTPDSTPESLVANADAASLSGKAQGHGKITVFGDALRQRIAQRSRITRELRAAIGDDQLVLRYQPIVSSDGATVSFEALARWNHPTRGLLGPDQFIEAAEESGLIQPLGLWVAREASRFARRLRDLGYTSRVSFNVSVRQFSGSLVEDLFDAIAQGGASPDALIVEITESAFANQRLVKSIVDRMQSRGVAISLDDFGTGYSALGRLTLLRVDAVKIDRSFVQQDPTGVPNPLLEPLILLGRAIGAQVVAEGVETTDELRRVLELGCDYIQGFLFAKPLVESAALEFLADANYGAVLAANRPDLQCSGSEAAISH